MNYQAPWTSSVEPLAGRLLVLAILLAGASCRTSAGSPPPFQPHGFQVEPETTSGPNRAQVLNPFGAWYLADQEAGWYFDLGLGVELEPDYAGSKDSSTEPDLFARAFYVGGGHRFFANLGEVGAFWSLAPDWVLATVLEVEEGRDASDNPALAGLDDIDSTVEGQVTLARRLGDFTLAGILQPDVLGRGKGFVTFLVLTYDRMLTESLRFATVADVSYGDSTYMQTEFGITGPESLASGLAAYDASAGWKSATLELQVEQFFSEHVSLLLGVSAEQYFSDASDSPLIADLGDDLNFEAGALLRIRF